MLFLLFRERQIGEEVKLKKEKTTVNISLKTVLILITWLQESLLVVNVDMVD